MCVYIYIYIYNSTHILFNNIDNATYFRGELLGRRPDPGASRGNARLNINSTLNIIVSTISITNILMIITTNKHIIVITILLLLCYIYIYIYIYIYEKGSLWCPRFWHILC